MIHKLFLVESSDLIPSAKMSPFGGEQDIFYMHQALEQAHRALQLHEVPIGALVVDKQGVILAQAHNTVEQKKIQTAHAEVSAIESACKHRNDWRLDDCWIYV